MLACYPKEAICWALFKCGEQKPIIYGNGIDTTWTMTDRHAGIEAAVAALPAKPHEFGVMLPDTNSRCAEW